MKSNSNFDSEGLQIFASSKFEIPIDGRNSDQNSKTILEIRLEFKNSDFHILYLKNHHFLKEFN